MTKCNEKFVCYVCLLVLKMPKDSAGPSTSLSPVSSSEDISKQLTDAYGELKSLFTSINNTHAKCDEDQQGILNLYDKIKSEDQKLSNYHR